MLCQLLPPLKHIAVLVRQARAEVAKLRVAYDEHPAAHKAVGLQTRVTAMTEEKAANEAKLAERSERARAAEELYESILPRLDREANLGTENEALAAQVAQLEDRLAAIESAKLDLARSSEDHDAAMQAKLRDQLAYAAKVKEDASGEKVRHPLSQRSSGAATHNWAGAHAGRKPSPKPHS